MPVRIVSVFNWCMSSDVLICFSEHFRYDPNWCLQEILNQQLLVPSWQTYSSRSWYIPGNKKTKLSISLRFFYSLTELNKAIYLNPQIYGRLEIPIPIHPFVKLMNHCLFPRIIQFIKTTFYLYRSRKVIIQNHYSLHPERYSHSPHTHTLTHVSILARYSIRNTYRVQKKSPTKEENGSKTSVDAFSSRSRHMSSFNRSPHSIYWLAGWVRSTLRDT